MDFKQIQELIKQVSKSELAEVKVKDGEFEIVIRTKEAIKGKGSVVAMPVQQSAPAAPAPSPAQQTQPAAEKPATEKSAEEAPEKKDNLITIKSPMIGTFYRSPSPDKDAFVKVGDTIQKGDVLCIIEAMKLFNEIESEHTGKIVKVLVEDSSPVEYDQPLFLIEP